MTLFETLKEAVLDDYEISFNREIMQLRISVKSRDEIYKESYLPLSDHFYEKRVVDCITWMIEEIKPS